jgi:hypothetical protein
MALAIPEVGGVPVPAGIYNRGEYMFYPAAVEIAGDGTAIATGAQSALWRFESITAANLAWWTVTALANARSRPTTFKLWLNGDRTTVQTFGSGIIYAPIWEDVRPLPNGQYGPVEIRFDYLLPFV